MKSMFLVGVLSAIMSSCNYSSSKASPASGNTATATPEALISYQLIKTNTTAVCLNCHSGNISPNLSTKQGLMDEMSLVLSEVSGGDMPPAQSGFSQLTTCQKAVLQKWFDLGSPDESGIAVNTLPECAVVN